MLQLKDPSLLRHHAYIDGQWCGADLGGTFDVVNPATQAAIGSVPEMGAVEARRAIEAANRAWAAWRSKTAKERSAVLRRWHVLLMAYVDDLPIAEMARMLGSSVSSTYSLLARARDELRRHLTGDRT